MSGQRTFCSNSQQGFALVAALFMLVVLAVLGAFAVRIGMTQQQNATLALLTARADAAAHGGVEYAAARLLDGGNCSNVTSSFPVAHGFTIRIHDCQAQTYTVDGSAVVIYTLTSTATQGLYGNAEFVSRSVTVRVTG